MIVSYCFIST